MNEWELAALVLVAALAPCLVVCLRGSIGDALVAFELASVIAITVLVLLSEGFHRQPFVDLAVILAFVSLVGGLAFARFLESE